ncbi:hypothetical protein AB0L59_07640 [Streptomyces sp. NPDC052109]|uniref:hypothetical protein n=1 Tax=Streptomyces sp. NPDC052109 TaxID=3155527 RepID=UPI00343216B8
MSSPVEAGARAAARRLDTPHTSTLAADVEVALNTQEAGRRPDQYFDPISLGAFIVSIATLAWTIYNDLRKDGVAPQREVITRRIRVQFNRDDSQLAALSSAEHDRYIDITVEETLNAADPNHGNPT